METAFGFGLIVGPTIGGALYEVRFDWKLLASIFYLKTFQNIIMFFKRF